MKDFKVLRNLFLSCSLLNFFGNGGFILLIPYFTEMPFLGEEKYGVAMMVLALGMMTGSILLSIKNIKRKDKFKIFVFTELGCTTLLVMGVLTNSYAALLLCCFIGFFFNVIFNTIFSTTLMGIVPSDIRGKVMAITSTISMGLAPIGQVVAGVLGDIIPVRLVLVLMFLCSFITSLYCVRIKNLKRFLEYDSEHDNLDEIMSL